MLSRMASTFGMPSLWNCNVVSLEAPSSSVYVKLKGVNAVSRLLLDSTEAEKVNTAERSLISGPSASPRAPKSKLNV